MKGAWPLGDLPGADLPAGASQATGDPTLAALTDPTDTRIYLLEASPADADGTTQAQYLASHGFATGPSDTPAHQLYRARLRSPYNVETSVMRDGRPGGRTIPSYGEIVIANPDGELDALVNYTWAERSIVVKGGTASLGYSQFPTVFNGTSPGPRAGENELFLPVLGKRQKLDKPIQPNLYRGYGACIRGNGTSSLAAATISSPAGSMTMEAVVRPATTASANKYFMGWQSGGAAGGRFLRLSSTANNRLTMTVVNDAATIYTMDYDSLTAGTLYRVSGVLDLVANQIRLYLDGELVGTPVTVAGTFNTVLSNYTLMRNPNAANGYFDGDIDDVRVWSTARTQAQIKEYKDRELLGTETGLVQYHKLNEGTGTTSANAVGGGTALTLTNCTWTSSLEGDSSVAGNPKPLCFGESYQVEPILIDPTNLVYQVHDGTADAISAVLEAGAAITAEGDVSDLYATTVTAGYFKTDLARGLFRLGSSPTRKISAQVRGDKVSGVYVNKAGDVAKRIFDRLGYTTTDVNATAFSNLATANAAPIGVYIKDEELAGDVIDRIMDTVHAWWGPTRAGVFTCAQITNPADGVSSYTLTEADLATNSVEILGGVPAPAKRVALGYRPYSVTLTLEEAATGTALATRQDYGQAIRWTAPIDDASVSSVYLDATEIRQETLFRDSADATTEAARLLALYSTPRSVYRLPLARGFFRFALGDIVTLSLVERFRDSRSASCLLMDGDDYVSYGDILNQGAGDSFTAEILIRPTATVASAVFAGKTAGVNSAVNPGWAIWRWVGAPNWLYFTLADGVDMVEVAFSVLGPLYDGDAHRVSLVVNRSDNKAYLYVDGVIINSGGTSISSIGTLTNSTPLYLGRDGAAHYYSGNLDDFRFWPYARTADQVLDTALRSLTAAESATCSLHTTFDEGSGTSAADSSGNARTGTITGATWASVPWQRMRKKCLVVGFAEDAVNDSVAVTLWG